MTSPSTEPSTLESIRERLAREWTHLKAMVRTKFSKLTDDDVAAVNGRYDELSSRLSKTYGYPQDRSEEEISRFVSEGGNSALYASTPDEAQAGDHRGMGAEVGRDDKPDPNRR
jgi:uncharacterized protein YjbJ (UPF0337 family)